MTYTARLSTEPPDLAHLNVRCSPTETPAPPPPHLAQAVRENRCFTAYDEDGNVVGNAVLTEDGGRVEWVTLSLHNAAEVFAALAEAFDRPVWGNVQNPALREAMLQHPDMRQDSDNPQIIRWRH